MQWLIKRANRCTLTLAHVEAAYFTSTIDPVIVMNACMARLRGKAEATDGKGCVTGVEALGWSGRFERCEIRTQVTIQSLLDVSRDCHKGILLGVWGSGRQL